MENKVDFTQEVAFPIPNDPNPGSYMAQQGMLLIDYFAAHAMAICIPAGDGWHPCFAKQAYDMAEAMMEERYNRYFKVEVTTDDN